MMVSIQVDASYRTMENGRLRKESRVFFPRAKPFYRVTSAHSRPPQFLSVVYCPGSHSIDFTITIAYKRPVEIYLNGDVFLLIFTGWGHLFMARRDSN